MWGYLRPHRGTYPRSRVMPDGDCCLSSQRSSKRPPEIDGHVVVSDSPPPAAQCSSRTREAQVSPTAVPPRTDSGAWLARYGELQNSLFLALARPLGLAGAGGREAFGDLFQIAVSPAWARERDGEPIRNPRAFLRQVIINQRKMQLRTERRHPATSYDQIVTTADGTGGSGIDAIADRRPSVSEPGE